MISATVVKIIDQYGADKVVRVKSGDQVFFSPMRSVLIWDHTNSLLTIIDKNPQDAENGLSAISAGFPKYTATFITYEFIETIDMAINEGKYLNLKGETPLVLV